MSIIKVTELDETTGLTPDSVFLVSYVDGPPVSKKITIESLRNIIDKRIAHVSDGNSGMSNVENIRIVNGPVINADFAPYTATFDFSEFQRKFEPRLGGSFYSTETQTTTGTTQPMTFNNQDVQLGVGFVSGSTSQILVAYTGYYNIQFSAQLIKTQGGTSEDIYIWLRKNGTDVPDSNTKLTLANNGQYVVAAWNFLIGLQEYDNIELMWGTSDNHIQLPYINDSSTPFGPAIPSVILTITQV